MPEVVKVGDDSFVVSGDGSFLYRIENLDFQLRENFVDSDPVIELGGEGSRVEAIDGGFKLSYGPIEPEPDVVKAYITKFDKIDKIWGPPKFYAIPESTDSISAVGWNFFYSNSKYTVYIQYGTSLPAPLFEPGYKIPELEEVIEESSSSSSSEENSSSETNSSTHSSSSSSEDVEPSSSSSSLLIEHSSSSEEILSVQTVDRIYLKIDGNPFTDFQYELINVGSSSYPAEWSSSSHGEDTLTSGVISVKLLSSGRFVFNANVVVDGCAIVIEDSVLSNIKNSNFASKNTYIKGFGQIDPDKIVKKCSIDGEEQDSYNCLISYESMIRSNGVKKAFSSIIKDYERNEMIINDEASKVKLFFASPPNMESSDVCRGWGYFCLNNTSNGVWSSLGDNESIELTHGSHGEWQLTRKYRNSLSTSETIVMRLDYQDISSNESGDDNFTGLTVVRKDLIKGGVEISSAEDSCNSTDSLVVLQSDSECSQNEDYNPFAGNLSLTLSGGSWGGSRSFNLKKAVISGNLSVWATSTNSERYSHEYAVLFSLDGVNWRLNVGNLSNSDKSYLLSEFIHSNIVSNEFTTMTSIIPKSNVSINGDRSSGDITAIISGV